MSVLIEGLSVVIRYDSLLANFPGGLDGLMDIAPKGTLCSDKELVRAGFMMPEDVKAFVDKLEKTGMLYLNEDMEAVDMVVVDQIQGLLANCDWAEVGKGRLNGDKRKTIAACRRIGSQLVTVSLPLDWTYEGSLSQSFGFIPTEHMEKSLKFLRHENGVDFYFNYFTGEEVYARRM